MNPDLTQLRPTIMKSMTQLAPTLIALAFFTNAVSAQSSFEVTVTVVLIDNVQIPAQEPGVIHEFLVRENELVRKGQPVVQLESEIHALQFDVAQQELAIAEKSSSNDVDVRYAEKSLDLAKNERLRSEQADAPLSEMERADLEVVRAGLSIEQAKRDQEIAKLQEALKKTERDASQLRLDRRTMTSPIEGIFVERFRQAGEWVNAGQDVLRVINLKRLHAKALLKATEYDASLLGREVRLTVELPNHSAPAVFQGRITIVSPEVNPITDEFLVTAEIENPQMILRPGSIGQMTILLDSRD